MISSNTRATRSRYSSPAQPTQPVNVNGSLEAPKSAATEGSKSFMQKWLEPNVQAKTSFEEAGLMRYGVLENMAPLGSLPKVKKTGPDGTHPVRKIILRPSGVKGASSAQVSPRASSPSLSAPKGATASSPPVSPTPARGRPPRASLKEEEDDEYDPKGASRRRRSGRATASQPAMATSAKGETTATPAQTPKRIQRPSSGTGKRHPLPGSSTVASRHRDPVLDPEVKEFTDKVVESAVDEALKRYRYPTAWALRTLYDEKSEDADFVAMIEDVFNQTADADTMKDFCKQIEEKKREGKKDNQGCYYFIPPSTNSRFTPHKPKPAPYAHLLKPHNRRASSQMDRDAGSASASGLSKGASAAAHADHRGASRATKKLKTSHGGGSTPRKTTGGSGLTNGSGMKKTPSSSRRRARRGSASSDSSLSSAMSLSSPEGSPQATASPSLLRGATTTTGTGGQSQTSSSAQRHAPKSWPTNTSASSTHNSAIAGADSAANTTRSKLLAAPNKHNSSDPRPPTSHPTNKSSSSSSPAVLHANSMPGRLSAAELFPKLARKTSDSSEKDNHHGDPVAGAGSGGSGADASLKDDEAWSRRRQAQKITNSFTAHESSVRGAERQREREATPARSTRRTRQSLAPLSSAPRSTRSASKRPNDDAESTVSPSALSFQGDGPSAVASRSVTPSVLRPTKKQKTGLRVKSSPVKKKGGTAAGVPRSVGEAQSSVTNGVAREQSTDNDEYCSACGNAGDVVCCDGCPRSFHFECVDMVPSDDLPDEWYCNECLIRRYPSRVPIHKGAFAGILNNLEKSIPRAFSLPKRLQNRFEGVRAGADGDYEEIVTNRPTNKRKTGYDETPDFFKQREDGQAVLCHQCQKPASENRAIVPCSICSLYWHIDCLDPPLAVPPVLKTWRCPAHIGDVLADAPLLAPAHRFRRIKSTKPIAPAFTRGVRNNGHIEIDWSEEPDEPLKSGWPDVASFGRTYKLPARGVILDFVEQLREQGAGYGPRHSEPRLFPYPCLPHEEAKRPLAGSDLQRSMDEMQLSLSLTSLKQRPSESVDQLTSALLAAADQNVLTLMAKANADNLEFGRLSENDKLGLRALLTQMDSMSNRIRDLLGENPHCSAASALASPGATSVPDVSAANSPQEKMEHTVAPAEPTPPSTVDQADRAMDLD